MTGDIWGCKEGEKLTLYFWISVAGFNWPAERIVDKIFEEGTPERNGYSGVTRLCFDFSG